jgi:hypothetical protein
MAKAIERKEYVLSLTEKEAQALLQFFYDQLSSYYSTERTPHLRQIEKALEDAGIDTRSMF